MSNDNIMMMTISGADASAFLDNFAKIAAQLGFGSAQRVNAAPTPPTESAATTVSEPSADVLTPPKQTRRGRPSTKPVEVPAEAPSDPTEDLFDDKPEAASVEEKKPVTMDEAKDAGRGVIGRGGVDALRKILDEFKVQKVADLKADQLESFVAKCAAA